MIGEGRSTALNVMADSGEIGSAQAVSMGLIVTELVINAIKYAVPVDRAGAQVLVSYKNDSADSAGTKFQRGNSS
jgi:two-component sensor histidine kinase